MDNKPLQYTTDFLYLLKRRKNGSCNSLITHDLPSLMQGFEYTFIVTKIKLLVPLLAEVLCKLKIEY
ncbi:hypothetical protein KHA80_16610 [Anaerobacillus sp. HL2]|nr:hypothetical protein KHA80_16610 [Anaerobacillus sp. HL2]